MPVTGTNQISRGLALAGKLLSGLCDAALPQTCVSCGLWIGGGGAPACPACHAEIARGLARPYCPRCGRTLPTASIHDDHCARCRTEPFWNVKAVVRVGPYSPALRRALLGLKYAGQTRNADYLGIWLAAAIRACAWAGELDALVPVPMHWLRRWQRPCDHARLLAEAAGRELKLPVLRLVRRSRHAPSQTTQTSRAQRFDNVKDSFGPPPWWRQWPAWRQAAVHGRVVCIIDNLVVAGATIYEMSKVLRRAGAKRIYAATVARPPAPGDPPVLQTEPLCGTGL